MILRTILVLLAGALIGAGLVRYFPEITGYGDTSGGDASITRGTIADTTFRQGRFEVTLEKQRWEIRPVLEGLSWLPGRGGVWLRYSAHLHLKTDGVSDGDVALIPFRAAFMEFDGTGIITGPRLAAARMRDEGFGWSRIFTEIDHDMTGREHWKHWARHVGVELDTIRLVRATRVPEQFAEDYPDLLQSASAVRGLD